MATNENIRIDLIENGTTTLATAGKYCDRNIDVNVNVTGGGGSVEGVCYVTFMSDDGETELYKKPVFAGDHCMNPVEMGWLDTPTKEASAEYTYSYIGWATEPNGALNADALKNVTEDRTVYACFASEVRYYTVRFFDGDTLLHTAYAEYGSTPSYTPEKDGYYFNSWNPAPDNIVADLDCYAVWDEKLTFANGSWEKISEVCEAGQASEYFAVGDTKTFFGADGTTEYQIRIIGINVDTKYKTSLKAGITVALTKPGNVSIGRYAWHNSSNGNPYRWSNSAVKKSFLTFEYRLPSELQSVIKPVDKLSEYKNGQTPSVETTRDFAFLPSVEELGGASKMSQTTEGGFVYEGLASASDRVLYDSNGEAVEWMTRTCFARVGVPTGGYEYFLYTVKPDGTINSSHAGYKLNEYGYVLPCFCI